MTSTSKARASWNGASYAVGLFDTGQKTMPLEWKDADDVVGRLGEKFMKRVLENAGRISFVRFGLTGSGQYPNYQVEVDGADPVLYAGLTHKVWTGDIRTFESDNLSQRFASADLLAAFVKHFRRPKAR